MKQGTRWGSRTSFSKSEKARQSRQKVSLIRGAFLRFETLGLLVNVGIQRLVVVAKLLAVLATTTDLFFIIARMYRSRTKLNTPFRRMAIFAVAGLLAPLGVLSFVLLHNHNQARAAINEQLHFQARLLSAAGSLAADGNYNVQFNIYSGGDGDPGTGGDETLEWTGSWLKANTEGIDVANGYVSAQLGSEASQVNTLADVDWGNATLWLSINIGDTTSTSATCTTEADFNTNCGGDGEMGPFIRLGSTPYAFNSSQLDGRTADQFVQLDPGGAPQSVNTANTVIEIDQDGAGDLIDLAVATASRFNVNNAGDVTASGDLAVNGGNITSTGALSVDVADGNNFTVTDGTNTLLTVSDGGAVGNVTVSGTTTSSGLLRASSGLTVDTGATFTNASSSLYTAVAVADIAAGGDIGTAGTTVDVATTFDVTQTTASQTLTLPDPTVATSGRIAFVNNVGTASFTMYGSVVASGQSNAFIWNGSSWVTTVSLSGSVVNSVGTIDSQTKSADGAVISANAIYLQTADASAPGLVSTGTQTFAGDKTFNGLITAAGGLTVSSGQTLTLANLTNCSGIETDGSGVAACSTSAGVNEFTVVVAASDSVNSVVADYVADGTNDEVEIESAISDANTAGGGTVLLLEGTYNIATPIDLQSDVALEGSGRDATILFVPNSTDNAFNVIEVSADDNVTIASLTIDGNNAGQTTNNMNGIQVGSSSAYPVIEDVLIRNNGDAGVYFLSAVNPVVRGSIINSNLERGVYAGTVDVRVEDNQLVGNGSGGSGHSAVYASGQATHVVNNYIDATNAGSSAGAIYTGVGDFYTIENNIIENTVNGPDIFIQGDNTNVSGNTIANNANNAIEASASASDGVISGNTIFNAALYGIYVEGFGYAIGDNSIDTTGSNGIYVDSNANSVTGNLIMDAGANAIELEDAARVNVSANNIFGPASAGIHLDGATNAIVTGNAIRQAGTNGISLDTSSHNNIISGNQLHDNGDTGGTDSVSVTGDYNQILGNYFYDSAGTSDYIGISASATDTYLADNTFDATGTYALEVNDAGANTVYASQLTDLDVLRNDASEFTSNRSVTLSGTVDVDAGANTLVGTGTAFDVELEVGDRVTITDTAETYTIESVTDATNAVFTTNVSTNDDSSAATKQAAPFRVKDTSGNVDLVVSEDGSIYTPNLTSCLLETDADGLISCDADVYLTNTLTDNITDALDIQEGTNNYININTTDSSENISFGNATTNPSFSFLGSGVLTVAGDLQVQGGDLTTNQTSFNVFNTTVTTLNIGGAATTIEVGAATGTTSINNSLTVDGNTTIGTDNADTLTINAGQSGTGISFGDGSFNSCSLTTVGGVLTCGTDNEGYNEATAVVGTTNGSNASSNVLAADYTADGTSDEDEINSAITAVNAAGGGTVVLLEGDYVVDGSILLLSDVEIIGAGRQATVITLADSTNGDSVFDETSNPDNWSIQDLSININSSNNTGSNSAITLAGTGSVTQSGGLINNIEAYDFDDNDQAIDITSSSYNVTISNSFFFNGSDPISVVGSGTNDNLYLQIINNNFNDIERYGIYLEDLEDVVIQGNIFSDWSGNSDDDAGIHLGGHVLSITIDNNIFQNGNMTGIYSVFVDASSGDWVIADNIFENIGYSAILGYTTSSVITGNSIKNTGQDGIEFSGDNAVFTGNVIENSGMSGIRFSDALANINNTTIVGNVIRSSTNFGIDITAGHDDNIISGNTLQNNQFDGVYLTGADDNLITGNRITNSGSTNSYDGVSIEGNSDNNQVTDNFITDNGGSGYAINLAASNVDNTYLADNTYSGTGAASINDNGTNTIFATQLDSSSNLELQAGSGGIIELLDNASITGLLTVSSLGTADTNTFLCHNSSSQIASCSVAPLTNALTDNITDALDIQEGTNNYININTTDSSENISFGNATTNPSFSFLGSGNLAVGEASAGAKLDVQVDDGENVAGLLIDQDDSTNDPAALVIENAGTGNAIQIDTNEFVVDASGNVGIGSAGGSPVYNISLGGDTARTIGVESPTSNGAGQSLRVVAGGGLGSFAGGNLILNGGDSGASGNVNGGNVTIRGGAGNGSGTQGLVVVENLSFDTASVQNFIVSGTITQANVDATGAVIIDAQNPGLEIIVPNPSITTAGRLMYVTAELASEDFTLTLNDGDVNSEVNISLRENETATLIWNGIDWTAAGASSSNTLQSAYNNTLTSAGGAEIVLNQPGGDADGFTIRNNGSSPINGGILEVQSAIGTNLLSVNNIATEYAANGGAEDDSTFSTDWTDVGTTSSTRETSTVATGTGAVTYTANASDEGVRNNLATDLTNGTQYMVSFTARTSSGTWASADQEVLYSPNGGTTENACTNASTEDFVSTEWRKFTCTVTASAVASNADLIIQQTDSTTRTVYIDNLSITENSSSSAPDNVQIGGGQNGGPVTLFTLDRASAPPVADGDQTYLGSMYYDTVTGRIQCYEADGWGACGSAPNNYVNLLPEYPGSVLNGTGVGTMSADFCSNEAGVLQVNHSGAGAPCSTSGEVYNYYTWTSPQATQQTYSIYVTYQLPAEFGGFESNSTVQLTARTDNSTNGEVSYEMFRNEGGAIVACGSETFVAGTNAPTTTADVWHTVGINGDEATGCGFSDTSADNFVIFKINMKANSNANVYASTLSFTSVGQ